MSCILHVQTSLDDATDPWGVKVERVEMYVPCGQWQIYIDELLFFALTLYIIIVRAPFCFTTVSVYFYSLAQLLPPFGSLHSTLKTFLNGSLSDAVSHQSLNLHYCLHQRILTEYSAIVVIKMCRPSVCPSSVCNASVLWQNHWTLNHEVYTEK